MAHLLHHEAVECDQAIITGLRETHRLDELGRAGFCVPAGPGRGQRSADPASGTAVSQKDCS